MSITDNSQRTHSPGHIPSSGVGFCNQLGEIRAESSAENNIPRVCGQFDSDDNQSSRRKSPEVKKGSRFHASKEGVLSSHSGGFHWSGKLHNSNRATSSSMVQKPAEAKDKTSSCNGMLRFSRETFTGRGKRTRVVEGRVTSMER